MKKIRFICDSVICTSLACVLVLTSACGKKDTDKVSEAQDCLDKSTSNTALSCLSKIDGIEGSNASLVRCSAYFIDQEFTSGSRLSQAATQITESGGGGSVDSRTLTALAVLGFVASKYTMAQNYIYAQAAYSECSKSSSPGLIYLSSMTIISTALLRDLGYSPGSGTPSLTAACSGGASTASTETKAAMGAAALAAYNSKCLGRDITNDVICQQYSSAVNGTSDPVVIGAALANNLCN